MLMLIYIAFGTPGVKEHGYFLKDVKDAREIRGRILECAIACSFFILSHTHAICLGFEQAYQPNIDDSERRRVLNFCIVGMSIPYHDISSRKPLL
jgi:NADH dehydrogenase FAD-containing subunit